MQQKQRLKALDRFKAAVQKIDSRPVELGESLVENEGAYLVFFVAAGGLDILNVMNVIHYQSPFNAEIYVHRCGRTARIGKNGQSLALIGPEDELNFKQIYHALSKKIEDLSMLDVKYSNLEMMRPFVEGAMQLEKAVHRANADEKAASWLVKTA